MADLPASLRTGLADRYRLERDLGRGEGAAVVEPADREDFGRLLERMRF